MTENIVLKFKDGESKEYMIGTPAVDVIKDHFKNVIDKAVAAKLNDKIIDFSRAINDSGSFDVVTSDTKEGLEVIRHTSSHVMALAIRKFHPKALVTIGPATEDGFYYDFDNLDLKEEEFSKIEEEMKKILQERLPVTRIELSKEEALQKFGHEPYKVEIIRELPADEVITAYKVGDFEDLCRGPHVSHTGKIGAIKLMKLAGAYWKGDSKNKMLTRVYGTSFPDKKQLQDYLHMLEEAKKRDHRKIGSDLNLFVIDEDIGPGLIIWLPKGNIIKEQLENWAKETEEEWGYQRITTPVITKEGLFFTSEHLPHYADFMFSPMEIDGQKYYIKPMNCPFHHKTFAARNRSYRELPLRFAEYGWCHRYENSGGLTGLMRVRGMMMNDSHIYCTREQAVDEFISVIKLHEYYYQKLGITDYQMELALRDPLSNKYHGDDKMWQDAENLMMQAMKKSGVKYTVVKGGAAFYGPKIDFQIKSVIGREFTVSTNQIDLFMPGKFKLKYAGEDGSEHTPVVIHRAPLGTHERFIGFLIEHFAGKFPLWLNPVQVKILPVSDKHRDYALDVAKKMKAHKIRVEVDDRSEGISKKVRDAQLEKVNYMLVVGDREFEENKVTVRTRNNEVLGEKLVDHFINEILVEINEKRI